MPYADPEPDDPHLLMGVSLPGDEAATREMAAAFADEFAQMGFDRERLLRLFSNPFFRAAHAARERLGDAEITRIVLESLRVYGSQVTIVAEAPGAEDDEEPEAIRGKRRLRVL
jgi:hypothetical protein